MNYYEDFDTSRRSTQTQGRRYYDLTGNQIKVLAQNVKRIGELERELKGLQEFANKVHSAYEGKDWSEVKKAIDYLRSHYGVRL